MKHPVLSNKIIFSQGSHSALFCNKRVIKLTTLQWPGSPTFLPFQHCSICSSCRFLQRPRICLCLMQQHWVSHQCYRGGQNTKVKMWSLTKNVCWKHIGPIFQGEQRSPMRLREANDYLTTLESWLSLWSSLWYFSCNHLQYDGPTLLNYQHCHMKGHMRFYS